MAVDRSSYQRSWPMMPSRIWRGLVAVSFVLMLLFPFYRFYDTSLLDLQHRDRDSTPRQRQQQQQMQEQQKSLQQESQQQQPLYNNTLYHGSDSAVRPVSDFTSPCDGFPNMDNITFVMKTGATEAFDKVPTQLLTNLQCLDDFLMFSDLEQQIGKYHIYNALDRVDQAIKDAHSKEFKVYEAQLTCPISQKDCTKDMGSAAWELDKFKFLHIAARTWEMRPGREWYIFAEADTYIVWKSLIHFMRTKLDPKKDHYVGSVALYGGFRFAHGGSGYVMSGAMLQKMVQDIPDVAAKYDNKTKGECCGDVMLAKAAKEIDVSVRQAFPMFNGEKPSTLPYGPGHWCEPILTMHHVNSEEVSAMWQFEQTRTSKGFIQIKDLYQAFFAPNLKSYRPEWNNMADDTCYIAPDEDWKTKAKGIAASRQKKEDDKNVVEKHAHNSAAACAKVCEAEGLDIPEDKFKEADTELKRSAIILSAYEAKVKEKKDFDKARKCFQWRYHNGLCCTGKSFKLGGPKHDKDETNKWTSGWHVRGIHKWIELQGQCAVDWKKPS